MFLHHRTTEDVRCFEQKLCVHRTAYERDERVLWISNMCLSPPPLPGVIIVPSAGVGIVLGGYIIKKLKLGARESAKLAMICSGVSLLCFSTLFIVGCESINLGGINIPYTTGWGASRGGKLGGLKFREVVGCRASLLMRKNITAASRLSALCLIWIENLHCWEVGVRFPQWCDCGGWREVAKHTQSIKGEKEGADKDRREQADGSKR